MDEHGCLIYELTDRGYVGECDCGLQVRGHSEYLLLREFSLHAGFTNPHLKRELERQQIAESAP